MGAGTRNAMSWSGSSTATISIAELQVYPRFYLHTTCHAGVREMARVRPTRFDYKLPQEKIFVGTVGALVKLCVDFIRQT